MLFNASSPLNVSRKLPRFAASAALAAIGCGALASGASAHSGCKAVSFRVLHNDRAGGVSVPAGTYRISSPTISCRAASDDFKLFITKYPTSIPEWNAKQVSYGHVEFAHRESEESFGAKRVGG